jgi:glycine hydroxymethyltransferase
LLSKIEFDIINMLYENDKLTEKELAIKLYKDVEKIKVAKKKLSDKGYLIDSRVSITGEKILKEHEIENAIILAAGMSTRFVPLSFEKPKGLLKVKGQVLIERQILQLREKGIDEIIIVVGYMKEQFKYLIDKFGVILIETKEYEKKNNHSSIYAARKYLKNSIITSSDLYFKENIFQKYAYDAYYTAVYKRGKTAERGIILDEDDRILNTMYGDRCYDIWVTLGYAFFNQRFSNNLIKILDAIYDLPETYNKFWADIQDENLKELYMYAKLCDENVIYEFDSLEELRKFDKKYLVNSESNIMRQVCYMLGAREDEIIDIESLRKIKKTLFRFKFRDCFYICDVAENDNYKISYEGYVYYLCRDIKKKFVRLYKIDKSIKVMGKNDYNIKKDLKQVYEYSKEFIDYHKRALPLCAAENVISKFVNLPLTYGFQERYIMNNTYSFNMEDNFIGCEKLFPFYQKISEICSIMFGARYTDARPFSGMNCIDMIVKTVCKPGDKIMILGKEHGGHASVKPVVERLGLKTFIAPFSVKNLDLKYEELNDMVKREKIQYILLAPSDIIKAFDLEKIDTSSCVLMWDCSQLLGLIAAKLCKNPLDNMDNVIMFAGTHKTFPGPASGLIMTNEKYLHDRMETQINPKYLRHSQMHQKISLLFALIEFEMYGVDYMAHMVHCSNYLGEKLQEAGYDIARVNGQISYTHQIFIRCDENLMNTIYDNAYRCEVTLNKKVKELFNGYGIRIGTQEIARYNWDDNALDIVAKIVKLLSQKNIDIDRVLKLKNKLPEKKLSYTFLDKEINDFWELERY